MICGSDEDESVEDFEEILLRTMPGSFSSPLLEKNAIAYIPPRVFPSPLPEKSRMPYVPPQAKE
jgi:hypothetical protein